MSVFEGLHTDIKKVLASLDIEKPTAPQDRAIPPVSNGDNVLLVAPTASGKTEAALIPVFHNYLMNGRSNGISIIYITPLRALNRDIFKRMIFWGDQLDINIQVRHGDTSRKQRRQQASKPPEMLITTPETLQAIIPSRSMRKHLRTVKWVIIDEIHDLATSKRGAQLTIGLERLEEIVEDSFQRIGLSATIGSPSLVADFLGGTHKVNIIEVEVDKSYSYDVQFVKPTEKDYDLSDDLNTSPKAAARLNKIRELIDKHVSTLVFVQGRGQAESLGHKLSMLDKRIGVHHGSLGRQQRHEIEDRFKEGELKAIICTSTLQLGIDIGKVDLTIQYLSPRQVITIIQRVGRAGHTIERRSKGITIAAYGENILESLIASKRANEKILEPTELHITPLDVLCHQIVGISLAKEEGVEKDLVYDLIKRAYPFRGYLKEEFDEMIQFLTDISLIDLRGDKLMRNGRGRRYYYENLGMIADERRYPFINAITDRVIGTVGDEFWSLRARLGLNVILRGKVWRIIRIEEERGVLYVLPSDDPLGALPGWDGELIPVPKEITIDVGDLRVRIAEEIIGAEEIEKAINNIANEFQTDKGTIIEVASEIESHIDKGFPLPTKDLIVLEAYDKYLIIHSAFGEKVNRTLGAIFDIVFSEKDMIYSWWNDQYRILVEAPFKINKWDLEDFKKIIKNLTPENVENKLSEYLETRFPFGYKMKFIAERFGVIPRGKTLDSKSLDNLYLRFKDTPIYRETLREAHQEKLDLQTVTHLFHRINEDKIQIIIKHTDEPSPLARYILEAYANVEELIATEAYGEDYLEVMKKSIQSRKAKLLCLNCGEWSEKIRIRNLDESPKCPTCNSSRLSMLRRNQDTSHVKSILKLWNDGEDLTIDDMDTLIHARKSADMILSYGRKAIEALSVYGIGPVTSYQVLSKMHRDKEDFYRDLLKAKIQYIKTRRYWDE